MSSDTFAYFHTFHPITRILFNMDVCQVHKNINTEHKWPSDMYKKVFFPNTAAALECAKNKET